MATYFNYMVLMLGLLYIGIPHGALDHLLAKNTQSSLVSFILKYLLIIGSYYIFWQYFPTAALLIFIIYSSFHFGESELVETDMKVDSFYSHIKAFLMGLCILLVIILSHPQESINVMTNCIGSPVNYLDKKYSSIAVCCGVLSFAYILMQSVLSKKWSYLGLLFLLMIGIKVPLILAFGIYFIFQHSANAWEHLKIRLNMNSIQLYKKSLFYTIGALFIFLLISFYSNEIQNINGLWAIFFMFIACISFPHFILMHVFYNSKNH
jgi:Brp/Blh family beta-carotene 15,15'-monooxygenase